jgi:transcriptional regulator with XRE-family HTH domain
MSSMKDIIRLPQDLGKAIRNARKELGLKTIDVAKHSGRSRDVLHRLEHGDDVTVSSLMAILAAMGLVLRIERAGLPTLQEMTARFSNLDDDDDDAP